MGDAAMRVGLASAERSEIADEMKNHYDGIHDGHNEEPGSVFLAGAGFDSLSY